MRDRKAKKTVPEGSEDFGEIFRKFSLWQRVLVESISHSPALRSSFLFPFLSPFTADFPALPEI